MNNHPDYWAYPSRYPQQSSSQPASIPSRILTTVALLIVGYYALKFFDLWPVTINQQAYETTIHLFPSRLILIMQFGMSRLGLLARDARRFSLEDLSNQQAKSEALQQMLGCENTRITTVVRKARTLSGIDNILPASTEIGPPGLGNWDNSCYQNSTLHGFASLPAFNQFISKSLDKMRQKEMITPTHEALVSFLGKLNAAGGRRRTLWTPAVLKNMDSWQQQDAQEYFSRMLDAVEKEDVRFHESHKKKSGLETLPDEKSMGVDHVIDSQAKSEDKMEVKDLADGLGKLQLDTRQVPQQSALDGTFEEVPDRIAGLPSRNPLDGMLAQSLKCRTCGFTEGLSLTQFNCLTVNLGNGSHCTLEDLLDEYTAPEDIDGVECTQCTQLANPESDQSPTTEANTSPTTKPKPKPVLSTKSKQITLGRLPTDLVIHINRSIFDAYGNQRKNTALVDFPANLNIYNQWCAPLGVDQQTKVEASYELRCAVLHYGRHEDGHYIAYAKKDKGWYCFNDEVVTAVAENVVLGRGNAFMLFYEAMDMQGRVEEEDLLPVVEEEMPEVVEVGDGSLKPHSVHGDGKEEDLSEAFVEVEVGDDFPEASSAYSDLKEEAIANEFFLEITDLKASETADQLTPPSSNSRNPLSELDHLNSSSEASDIDSATPEEVDVPTHEDTPIPAMRTASESASVPLHRRMEYGSVGSVF